MNKKCINLLIFCSFFLLFGLFARLTMAQSNAAPLPCTETGNWCSACTNQGNGTTPCTTSAGKNGSCYQGGYFTNQTGGWQKFNPFFICCSPEQWPTLQFNGASNYYSCENCPSNQTLCENKTCCAPTDMCLSGGVCLNCPSKVTCGSNGNWTCCQGDTPACDMNTNKCVTQCQSKCQSSYPYGVGYCDPKTGFCDSQGNCQQLPSCYEGTCNSSNCPSPGKCVVSGTVLGTFCQFNSCEAYSSSNPLSGSYTLGNCPGYRNSNGACDIPQCPPEAGHCEGKTCVSGIPSGPYKSCTSNPDCGGNCTNNQTEFTKYDGTKGCCPNGNNGSKVCASLGGKIQSCCNTNQACNETIGVCGNLIKCPDPKLTNQLKENYKNNGLAVYTDTGSNSYISCPDNEKCLTNVIFSIDGIGAYVYGSCCNGQTVMDRFSGEQICCDINSKNPVACDGPKGGTCCPAGSKCGQATQGLIGYSYDLARGFRPALTASDKVGVCNNTSIQP